MPREKATLRCCRARRAHDDERIDGAVADEHLDRTASTSGPRRDDRAAIDRDVWKTAVRRAISSEMGSENDDAVADRAQLYAQDAARGLVERVVVGEGDEGHDPYRWTDEDFPDKTAHSLLRRGVNLKPAKILTPCRSPALAGIFKSSVLVLSPVLAFNRERNDNEGHCVVALDPGIVSA